MDKTPTTTTTTNPKRGNKEQLKTKKKQRPLKVVYITNPIKFTATASEFRALVQELTGQDAVDVSDSPRFMAAHGGGPEEVKEGNVHAPEGKTDLLQKGSDLSTTFGSYDDDDAFYSPQMMEGLALASSNMWHQDENLDVFKKLDVACVNTEF